MVAVQIFLIQSFQLMRVMLRVEADSLHDNPDNNALISKTLQAIKIQSVEKSGFYPIAVLASSSIRGVRPPANAR